MMHGRTPLLRYLAQVSGTDGQAGSKAPKAVVKEICDKYSRSQPIYLVTGSETPFTCTLELPPLKGAGQLETVTRFVAKGGNKKEAEHAAASLALHYLSQLAIPLDSWVASACLCFSELWLEMPELGPHLLVNPGPAGEQRVAVHHVAGAVLKDGQWPEVYLPSKEVLQELQVLLGQQFEDTSFLKLACIHPSCGPHNHRRLAFLGDAVLGLAAAELLYATRPNEDTRALTEARSRLVSRQRCAVHARQLQLERFMVVEVGITALSEDMLAEMFEAVMAALYKIGGLAAAQRLLAQVAGLNSPPS